ncbi:MAG TPA: NfeD family protein [Terriglobales bacterium]|nr:NfeD family protein [Terriglobales bacterium]
MTWWVWIVIGCVLSLLELMGGGFYLLFSGLAALIVGFALLFGIHLPLWAQLLVFSVLEIVLLASRRPVLDRLGIRPDTNPAEDYDSLVGERAVALEAIASGATGKVEMRGAPWQAHNDGEMALASGQRCVVRKVNGLVLHVAAQ